MLPDHVQVTNLIHRYPELIDSGDFAGIGELFRHGKITVEDSGDSYTGADEVRAMYEKWTRLYPDNGTPHTRHVTTNLVLEMAEDGTKAEARSYVTVFQRTDTLPLQPIFSNRYLDTFEKVRGQWRFVERRMTETYPGDVSEHLMQAFGKEPVSSGSGEELSQG